MAQPYVSGPVDSWVLPPGVTTPLFLGHGEDGPQVDWIHRAEPLRVDISGAVPYDTSYQGRMARVAITLTRWNDSVYRVIQDVSSPATADAGVVNGGEIGALLMTENLACQLFLRFPYTAKPAFSTQVPGLRFPVTYLSNDSWGRLGVRPRRLTLVWDCMPLFQGFDASGLPKYLLYDRNVSSIQLGLMT